MGKTATNISIILGLITVAFAGYYMYTQRSATTLDSATTQQSLQTMLNNTKVFIEHRQTLEVVKMDVSLFEDDRFYLLRSFSTPIQEQPIGRPNPFTEVGSSNNI